jgi:hypothetical protein
MKMLRLRSTDHRVWRENRSVLLDGGGNFVRHITPTEARTLFAVGKKARHLRRACSAELTVDDKKVLVEATPNPISRETMLLDSTVDGHSVMDGREFFKRQVLAKHGECQLRSQNGQFMCTVRDPNAARPTPADASRTAPRPAHCHCKGWGQPEGRHHRICEWNLKAPPDEQALDTDNTAYPAQLPPVRVKEEKPSILDDAVGVKPPQIMGGATGMKIGQPRELPPATSAAVPIATTPSASGSILDNPVPVTPGPIAAGSTIVTPAEPNAPEPDDCVCKDFPKAEGFEPGKNHHPVCQWKDSWEARQAPEAMLLVNLETGEVGRVATAEEITAARSEQGFVLIGDVQYGVVTEAEAADKKEETPSAEAAAG